MPKINLNPHPRDAIPRNVRILLAANGWSQAELAKRMKVSEGTVSCWLSGRGMSIETLDRLAEVLHTTPAKLYTPAEEVADNCTRLIC